MISVKSTLRSRFYPLIQRSLQHNHGVRPMTVISKSSAEEYNQKNYTSRMNRTGRPVSPSVTIYSLPIAAVASISTRVTGVLLSLGAFGIGGIELMGGSGTALSMMGSIGGTGFLIAAPAKFAVAFPIVFHSLSGYRHFVWDQLPQFLNNDDVPKSSILLFGSSSLISLGLIFV